MKAACRACSIKVNLDAEIALAHWLADAARAEIIPLFRTGVESEAKGDSSPVTIADRNAEEAMRKLIAAIASSKTLCLFTNRIHPVFTEDSIGFKKCGSAGKLSVARAEMLESVPGWSWDRGEPSLASAREAKLVAAEDKTLFATRALGAYVARYGHLPRAREFVWNLKLNKWVDNRRQDARKGTEFDPDLVALLATPAPRPITRGSREEFEVAVPTYKREDSIKSMTLAMLRANRIAPRSVTLFVANTSQATAYAASLSGGEFAVFADRIVVGGAGIRAARNAIRTHFEPGTHVVSIDDDVRAVLAVRKGAFAKADVRDIVRDGALACDAHGTKLWGLYPVKNTYFMGARPFAGLAFVQGQFFGCMVDRDPAMALKLEIKEDHENTLKHFERDGAISRLEYAVADSVMYETPGGIQATELRTEAKNQRAAEKLKARFGDLITLFVRKSTGMTEIRYAR